MLRPGGARFRGKFNTMLPQPRIMLFWFVVKSKIIIKKFQMNSWAKHNIGVAVFRRILKLGFESHGIIGCARSTKIK